MSTHNTRTSPFSLHLHILIQELGLVFIKNDFLLKRNPTCSPSPCLINHPFFRWKRPCKKTYFSQSCASTSMLTFFESRYSITLPTPKSIKIHHLVLLDFDGSVLHSIAQRIEHVAICTKSIKLHRLLLLDSGLCIAKPWMLCICYCTKSIKLHRLLLLDSGLCIAKPWMLCICHCTKSIKLHRLLLLDSGLCIAKPWMLCICCCTNNWGTFLLHVDGFWRICDGS